MKLCARCGQKTPAMREDRRAILCSSCKPLTEKDRNQRRTWYRGSWKRTSKRLRATFPCARCGSWVDTQVDHRTPRSLTAGLQVLCRTCHQTKTHRDVNEDDDQWEWDANGWERIGR